MKLKITIMIIGIMLLFTACGDKKNDIKNEDETIDTIVEDNLSQYKETNLDLNKYSVINADNKDARTYFPWFNLGCSDYGYYYKSDNDFIYFFDKNAKKSVPLCNKAECEHCDEQCNAYFNRTYHLSYIQYYDGNVYTLSYSMDGYVYLSKISEDGSSREQYMTLYKQELTTTDGGTNYRFPEICIHRDYVYFVIPKEETPKLYRMKLGGEELEVVFELKGERASIYRIRPYGDFVFFQAGHFADDTMVDMNAGIFAINVNSGEMTLVVDDAMATYVVADNILYYDNREGIYSKDLSEGNRQKIVDVATKWDFSADGKYIYIENATGDGIKVYNLDGEYIRSINPLSKQQISKHFYGDGTYLFAYSLVDNETREEKMAYFDINNMLDEESGWNYCD